MHVPHSRLKLLPWIGGGLVLFIGIAALVFWILDSRSVLTSFSSDKAHVNLQYDTRLRSSGLGDQDIKDKVVLRLQQPSDEPELLVTVRYEQGLKPIATVAKRELRDALVDTINKTYPKRFPNYRQVSSRNLNIDGHQASELVFTYKSPHGDTVKQRFTLAVINDDQAVYLSQQSKQGDFDRLNKRYFNTIANSLQPN